MEPFLKKSSMCKAHGGSIHLVSWVISNIHHNHATLVGGKTVSLGDRKIEKDLEIWKEEERNLESRKICL